MGKVILNKPDKLVSLRSITMGRGTPEEDLNTYMDNQDQQEAECRQEEQQAFDTAWEIHKFCRQADAILSSDHASDMEIIHRTDEHVLTINIMMTEVESEVFKEYIRNHGSKFVLQNYWEEED